MTRRIHSCWLDSFPHTRVCEIFIHSINKQKKKNFLFSIFSGLYCGCVIAAHHDQIVKHVVSSFTFVRLWFASAIAWMNSPLAWLFPAALFFHATKDMGREVQCLPGQHVWIHQFTSSMPVFYIHTLFFIYLFLFIFLSFFLFLFYLIMIYFWTESNLLPILKWHPCWNGRARFVFPSKAWVLARPFLALWFLEHFSTNPMHTTLPPMHIYIYTHKRPAKLPIELAVDECWWCHIFVWWLMIKLDIRSNQLVPPLPDEIKDGQWLGVTVRSQGPGRKVLVSYFFFPQTFISLNNFDCWRVVFRVPGERKE